jgi:serine/threonine protein kinase
MKNEDLLKGSTNSILFTHKIKEIDRQHEDEMINQIIFKKYEVKKKLGKSSTIDLYEGVSLEDKKPVLIKIEPKTSEKLYLETEAYNLYTFKGFGIPELIKLGKKNNNLILIESKKGRSLYDLFMENNRKFSLNEICLIGIQCIERLKFIHSKNYIHRNIKPENFVIGLEDPHVIYIQNFYLCEKYRSSKTNQHAKFKYTKEIVGTERYGSVNALRGLRQGRRDDLESLCYMLIYFFLGKLPWQGISADSDTEKHEKLLKEKKSFKIENYKQIPKDFYTLFNYVKNLKFEEEPKYSLMIKLLQNIRNENQCYSNVNLFWVKKNNECKGANIKAKKEGFRERLYSKIGNSVKSEEKNLGIKIIKNIDVNIENIGEGYIDEDDDREDEEEEEGEEEVNNNNTQYGKSAYQLKVNRSISCEESNNKNQGNDNEENEENNSYREDALNHSNSSINTKVYKLNGPMELFIKRDIMNDEDINKIDGLQNNKSEQKMSKISKNNTQTIIE